MTHNQRVNYFKTSVLALLLLTLSACGDCGSNNDTQNNTTTEDMTSAPDADMTIVNTPDADMDVINTPDADMPGDMSTDMADMNIMEDTQLHIDGLSAPVDVRLDQHGVLFLSCQTDNDCFAAQGYLHAKYRLIAMDLLRRQTLGKLATAIGQNVLETDKAFRHLMSTPDGQKLEEVYYAQLNGETKSALESYANGVNAFLADQRAKRRGAKLSEEYSFILFNKDIPDWTPLDSIAVYMQLAYQLGERSQTELRATALHEALGADVASDIFTVRTGTHSSVYGASGESGSPNMLKKVDNTPKVVGSQTIQYSKPAHNAIKDALTVLDRATSVVMGPKTDSQGSNNWVLAPSMTANGNALLANDPHLTLGNPPLWHFVVIDSKTEGTGEIHVAGASIPSVPGIVVGHNEKVAWGTTTSRLDMSDVYIETLNEDGTAVIFNGQEVPIVTREFTFEVHNGQPITETFEYVPHHGPLISKDTENKRGVSVRWVAHEGGEDINFFVQMMKSQSVDEAAEALKKVRALNQSWVLADETGKIAWYPHSYIPNRPWGSLDTPTWMALPGDGSAEWDGFFKEEDTPQMFDPTNNFIVTANSDFDGSYNDGDPFNDGHTVWQWTPVQGFRFDRITDMINAGGNTHTPETMLTIQGDTRVLLAEIIVPQIISEIEMSGATPSAGAQSVINTFKVWQYTCPTGVDGFDASMSPASQDATEVAEAAGCAAFHVLLKNLGAEIFADELKDIEDFDARIDWYELQRAVHQIISEPETMNHGDAYFDNITTDDVVEDRSTTLLAAVEGTATELETLFQSADPATWLWGRIHVVLLESFFAGANIMLYNEGGQPNDGGFETVDVANPRHYGPREDTYAHNHAASFRTVIELDKDNGFKTWFQLPGGQIHDREDPRYLNLLEDWLTQTPNTLPFKLEDVKAHAQDEVFDIKPAE